MKNVILKYLILGTMAVLPLALAPASSHRPELRAPPIYNA